MIGMNPGAARLLSVARVIVGLLFLQHGAEKLWGFAGARIDHNFGTLRGFAGPLEVIGGVLIVLGLGTRTTAFVLCGEMAVAYFRSWAPRGFFPIQNGGEEAVLFCYLYLWLVTAGAGPWSLDRWIEKNRQNQTRALKQTIASWEGYGRSILRIIAAFTFALHGLRLGSGVLPALAGRRGAMPMPLDLLPRAIGYCEILAAILLFLGLFARPAAFFSWLVAITSYFYVAAPRGPWPIRNGGNEVLLYATVFLSITTWGAGLWSVDRLIDAWQARHNREPRPVAAG
jgi:putative oxidoreductase